MSVGPPLPPSFLPRPVQKQARQQYFRESPWRRLPDLSSSPQPPLPSCRLSLRFPLIPAAGGPESNYFSQGSTIHPSDCEGEAGVEEPHKPSLRHRADLWTRAAPGRASRAVKGRAALPRGLFVLPRAALRPPTSARLSGRRLAKGFPRRAPPSNRRRAGRARGSCTRTFQDPRLTRTAAVPRTLPYPPHPLGRSCSFPWGLLQGRVWTWSPGPLDVAL